MIKKASILIGFLSVTSAIGCANQSRELGVYDLTKGDECALADEISVAPVNAEESFFVSRIRDGMVVKPLNVQCVLEKYSVNELKYWSYREDPVAFYALAYAIYLEKGPCGGIDERERILIRALAINSNRNFDNTGSNRPLKRVPEAALALRDIAHVCRGEDTVHFSIAAYEAGFETLYRVTEG